jgi:hypothetical protein
MLAHLIEIFWVILAFLGVDAIGFIHEYRVCTALRRRLDATTEYANTFAMAGQAYLGGSSDRERHQWLLLHLGELQHELGSAGIVRYKPPFANYIHTRYHILPNTLMAMPIGTAHEHDISSVHDLMVAHIGSLQHALTVQQAALRNPLVWSRTGVRLLVNSPLLALRWFGLLSDSVYSTLSDSWLAKAVTFAVTAVGLFGSVVTIVLGWSAFIQLLPV